MQSVPWSQAWVTKGAAWPGCTTRRPVCSVQYFCPSSLRAYTFHVSAKTCVYSCEFAQNCKRFFHLTPQRVSLGSGRWPALLLSHPAPSTPSTASRYLVPSVLWPASGQCCQWYPPMRLTHIIRPPLCSQAGLGLTQRVIQQPLV